MRILLQPISPNAIVPTYGTEKSACFDLYACIDQPIKVYSFNGLKYEQIPQETDKFVVIHTNERMLVPTGFIFGIPDGYSLRIHPRSGIAFKNGVTVGNCEGIIDCDYPEQTYVMLTNISDVPFKIEHGMRIAQGEIVKDERVDEFVKVDYNPAVKTDRISGVGSTGV
jgi:dUTP pyrophosphatase